MPMKRSFAFVVAVLLLTGALGCGHPSGKLVGTWKMVFPSNVSPGDPEEKEASGKVPVKILSETHFAFGSTAPDGFMYAGGGRYTLEGDTYTEIVAYHFNPNLVGEALSFTCRLEGDRWYHSGIFEVDGEHFHIEEIWQRIE
jgi:hypothetical protein